MASGFSSKAGADVTIAISDGQLTIHFDNESLVSVLEHVGQLMGFTVEWQGQGERPPIFNGKRSGEARDVLASLLRSQNHVIIYERVIHAEHDRELKPAHILLLDPPRSAPRPEQGDRSGQEPSGSDATALDHAKTLNTVAAAAPPARDDPEQNALSKAQIADFPIAGTAVSVAGRPLTESGSALPDLIIDPHDANISVTIDVGDEAPLATHVMAHTPAGLSLQQTIPGHWEPWDGQIELLVDTGTVAQNGRLTFQIMQGDLSQEFFPLTFAVAYQTGSALKYGVFQAMPDQRTAP